MKKNLENYNRKNTHFWYDLLLCFLLFVEEVPFFKFNISISAFHSESFGRWWFFEHFSLVMVLRAFNVLNIDINTINIGWLLVHFLHLSFYISPLCAINMIQIGAIHFSWVNWSDLPTWIQFNGECIFLPLLVGVGVVGDGGGVVVFLVIALRF